MKKIILAALSAGMIGHGTDAAAQSYPTRAISMVVPYAAGGSTDEIGRASWRERV